MANEHVLVVETHIPVNFNKATNLALEQGEIVELIQEQLDNYAEQLRKGE